MGIIAFLILGLLAGGIAKAIRNDSPATALTSTGSIGGNAAHAALPGSQVGMEAARKPRAATTAPSAS